MRDRYTVRRQIKGLWVLALSASMLMVGRAHAQQNAFDLQTPLWDQVQVLQCTEQRRVVCLEGDKSQCRLATGSAVLDVDFKGNAVSSKLVGKRNIVGYSHKYFSMLGTAQNVALLSDGAIAEFQLSQPIQMRTLRSLGASVVVIDFRCLAQ